VAVRGPQAEFPRKLVVPPSSAADNVFVVVGRPPSDLDAVFVAPDPEVLGVDAPSLDAIKTLLRTVPVEPAIFGLSAVAAGCWFAGHNQTAHLRLAEELFVGRPILDRLRAFVREDPRHLIFNEQHLTMLTRLLLQHGADGDPRIDLTAAQIDALLMAMVAMGGLTARHADPEVTPDADSSMGWVPWLVRSGLYFDQSNLGNDQGRAYALFVALAGEADPQASNWCDLDGWMRNDVAPVVDQFGFGYAMAAFTKALDERTPTTERFIGVVTDGLLSGNLPAGEVDRLVDATSATREQFVADFAENGDTVDHLLWDRAVFERRPFLRLRDERLVLLSPRFLHAWMGEGQYYRLLDSAMRRPDPVRPRKKATLRFTRFHGELVERYIQRLTEASHADQIAAGVVRVHRDRIYTGRDGSESRSPDLILDFTTDLVAIEMTGGRPARRARVLSDPELMIKELDDRVIGKMRELDAAVGDVLDGIVEIPDSKPELLERVWPVVIVPSTIIQSSLLWDYIDERSPGLFQGHAALQGPTLFSFDDYQTAMAAVETGRGLPTLLAERLSGVHARLPPSHFFAARTPGLPRARYLNEQLREAGEGAVRRMFGPSSASGSGAVSS
jgi:hypothetical protein